MTTCGLGTLVLATFFTCFSFCLSRTRGGGSSAYCVFLTITFLLAGEKQRKTKQTRTCENNCADALNYFGTKSGKVVSTKAVHEAVSACYDLEPLWDPDIYARQIA